MAGIRLRLGRCGGRAASLGEGGARFEESIEILSHGHRGGIAVVTLARHRARANGGEGRTEIGTQGQNRGWIFGKNARENERRDLARIRRHPGEHGVEHSSKTVDVAARVHALAARLLRSDERGSAEDMPGQGERRTARFMDEAEVGDVRTSVGGDQDVFRLDVAVDETGGVRELERSRDLGGDACSL